MPPNRGLKAYPAVLRRKVRKQVSIKLVSREVLNVGADNCKHVSSWVCKSYFFSR